LNTLVISFATSNFSGFVGFNIQDGANTIMMLYSGAGGGNSAVTIPPIMGMNLISSGTGPLSVGIGGAQNIVAMSVTAMGGVLVT
jgi:hypothetical protein